MAINYGSDTSCVTDLSRIDQQISNPTVLIAQRLARRLQTPRGALGLIGGDKTGGLDVRQYTLGKSSPNDTAIAQQQIKSECMKDEEVQSVDVTVTPVSGGITIVITGVSSAGPFSLTMNVGQLTTAVVFGS
jgi:hypothetical protein